LFFQAQQNNKIANLNYLYPVLKMVVNENLSTIGNQPNLKSAKTKKGRVQ